MFEHLVQNKSIVSFLVVLANLDLFSGVNPGILQTCLINALIGTAELLQVLLSGVSTQQHL